VSVICVLYSIGRYFLLRYLMTSTVTTFLPVSWSPVHKECDLHMQDWDKCSHFLVTKFCTDKEHGDYIISHYHARQSWKIIINLAACCFLDVTSCNLSILINVSKESAATHLFIVQPTVKRSVGFSARKASHPLKVSPCKPQSLKNFNRGTWRKETNFEIRV